MNDATVNLILIDAIEAYLGSGKSVAQIARDLRHAGPGDGFVESAPRRAVRSIFGIERDASEGTIALHLKALTGKAGTNGVLTRTPSAGGDLFSVA